MKGLPALITICLLAAGLPLAGAAEPCTMKPPRDETLKHPTDAERFFVIDLEAPTKTGEWQNTNHRAGIQTEDCGSPALYRKDVQSPILA